jgi:diguanylate cyclase (GGDEF)-like protein
MRARLANRLDRLIGLRPASAFDEALLRERLVAIKRQMPWMHGMLLASLAGLVIAIPPKTSLSMLSAGVLFAILIVRAPHMVRIRTEDVSAQSARLELRRTFLVANLYFVVSLTWQLSLYFALPSDDGFDIAMFAGIAALGASGALSSFSPAARIPLLVGALPFAGLLTLGNRPADQAVGFSLLVVLALRLRLLNVQNLAFERLVRARFALEMEKRRAVEAELDAITQQARAEEIANRDPLTGLVNRRGFVGELAGMPEGARRDLALILLDLDGFKPINDTFGHLIGDQMLVEVSRRLLDLGSGARVVARLGGDEFAVVCRCESAGHAVVVAQQAIASISVPYKLDGREMRISACAGVSFQGDKSVNDALRRADIALYDAKRRMRGSASLFTEQMEDDVRRRTAIEQALRDPQLGRDIKLAFQPIFDLESLELSSFEALARWRHPDLGWISPAEFIPISEQISVLQELSETLLARAAAAARHWPERVSLSFNLSPVQLGGPATASSVLATIARERLDASRLLIEVTETALLADFEAARGNLSQLRKAGVRIVLDDFGAGYSSISYLREMSFDAVKLDGSLLSSSSNSGNGLALLEGVLALCRAMGQPCIAEYVENDDQLRLLRTLGCRYGQGFGLCPPISEPEAQELIRSGVLKVARAQGTLRQARPAAFG